eukprot:6456904-Amphidinium_carterae.2
MRSLRQHLRWKLMRRVGLDHRCRQPDTRPGLRKLTKLRSNQKPQVSDPLGDKLPVETVCGRFVRFVFSYLSSPPRQLAGYLGSPPS